MQVFLPFMPPTYPYYSLSLYIQSNFKFCSFHLTWTISTSLKVWRILRANYPITSKILSVHFIKSRILSKTIQCNHPNQEISTDMTIVQFTDLVQVLPVVLTIFLFCFGKKWSSPRIHIILNSYISLLSFNLEWFPYLSLFFMILTVLKHSLIFYFVWCLQRDPFNVSFFQKLEDSFFTMFC